MKIARLSLLAVLALGTGSVVAGLPALANGVGPGMIESASSPVLLASNVVRRPVFDSGGRAVNRLPGRSSGATPARGLRCGQTYGGKNTCRPYY